MTCSPSTVPPRHARHQVGFSLVELMISLTIGLIILIALGAMFVNVSSSNNELAKANSQIENGRHAIQILENDVVHAGLWGAFVPQFDDLNWPYAPNDTPFAIPDPCLAYSAAAWDFNHVNNLVGIVLQSGEGAPGTCVLADKKGATDVLVVRHAATCMPGEAGCDADVAGKLYFQSSQCASGTAGTAQAAGNSPLTIALRPALPATTTSPIDNAYVGMRIRTTGGTGAGQTRVIGAYNGTTFIATVTATWDVIPDASTTYSIVEDLLATSGFTLHGRGANCAAAPVAAKRKFVSNIYYVRDYASVAGDGIPTLVRSSFDPAGPVALAHQGAEALAEGIEKFAVELGIDNAVARCGLNTAVDFSGAVAKVDPAACAANVDPVLNTLPTNRGDGNPDVFIRCTAAAPCTAAQLTNVVAAKLYVLVRNTEPSAGYVDSKTYCLATVPAGGACPAAGLVGPLNDRYKRHLFSTTVRLTNIAGRRESP
ncbi:PilW family protein [Massilia sp. TWR1-2-2]|uniref:PilW family protein n=1 Tax=Massilia sp. TWR1-2-2 TaxID=2804584 RepID=UPI003CF678F3